MTDHVHIWKSKWMRLKDTCGLCLPHHSGFAMLINEDDYSFHNVLFHVSNQKFAAPKQHVSAYLGYLCSGLLQFESPCKTTCLVLLGCQDPPRMYWILLLLLGIAFLPSELMLC